MNTKEFLQKYGIWLGLLLLAVTLFIIFLATSDDCDKNNVPDKFSVSCPGEAIQVDAGASYYKHNGKYYAHVASFTGGLTREITKNEYIMAYDEYRKRCKIQ